jgi:hypothetical protein
MRHFSNNGDLGKIKGLLNLKFIVILHERRRESLVWYAMALEWP